LLALAGTSIVMLWYVGRILR